MPTDLTVESNAQDTRYYSPRALANKQALDAVGIDTILERVSDGHTLRQIASDIGVAHTVLIAYIDRFAAPEQYARARQESAEAWADRGWQCLQLGDEEIDAARVNLARYKEQHCMRRAGIANPRYSEKQQVELTGANGGPVQSLVTVYVPANGRDERVIDAE